MARFPLRRYTYIVVVAVIAVLFVPLAIRCAQQLRARGWCGGSAEERLTAYYENVLKHDPGNVTAIKMLGSLYFDLKKFDESRKYYGKAIEADPDDPESYYSIAVIDWTEAYQTRSDAKGRLGLAVDHAPRDLKACEDLRTKNSAAISEGMEMLLDALALHPDYKNAANYMALLWREKAYIECGDAAASRRDLERAEQWMKRNKRKLVPSYDESRSARLYTAGVAADSSSGTRNREICWKAQKQRMQPGRIKM